MLRAIVHTPDHVRAMLAEAARAGRGVVLVSPPRAAGVQGVGWWLEMLAVARAEFPGLDVTSVLDCGEAAGLALAALAAGVPAVAVDVAPATQARLRDIALQKKARLVCERAFALDLQDEPDPRQACRDAFNLPDDNGAGVARS